MFHAADAAVAAADDVTAEELVGPVGDVPVLVAELPVPVAVG